MFRAAIHRPPPRSSLQEARCLLPDIGNLEAVLERHEVSATRGPDINLRDFLQPHTTFDARWARTRRAAGGARGGVGAGGGPAEPGRSGRGALQEACAHLCEALRPALLASAPSRAPSPLGLCY